MAVDVGLVEYLSKANAIRYGSVGISNIRTLSGTSKIVFDLVDGNSFTLDLSSLSIMWKETYDINSNGVVDKTEKLKNNTDNSYNDGSFYLNRDNHTGSQDATTVTVDKTGFNLNLKGLGTVATVQDVMNWLDTFKTFEQGLSIGKENVEGSFKILPENNKLAFYRYQSGAWVKVSSIGSFTTDYLVLTNRDSSLTFLNSNKTLKYNGMSLGTLNDSLRLGDTRFENIFIAGNELYKVEHGTQLANLTANLGTDVEQSISEFDVEFIADSPTSSVTNYEYIKSVVLYSLDIWCSEIVNGYGIIVTEKDTGLEVYRSRSDFEIAQCMDTPSLPVGKNTVNFPIPIYLRCGGTYILTIKADKSYKLKGIISDSKFYPYLSFAGKWVYYYKITDEEWLKNNMQLSDATDSNSSTTIASSKAVNNVRKLISTAVSGMTYLGAISCEAFVLLDNANTGNFYKLSNDGTIFGKQYKANTSVVIKNQLVDTLITEDDVDFFTVEATGVGGIWVTNVTNYTTGKNVSMTMKSSPNNGCVDSITTDDTKIYVTVEWDRGVEEYCGIPIVNGQDISSYATKVGGTFTATILLDISDVATTTINCDNNGTVFSVPIIKEVAPTINALTIKNTATDYPTTNSIQQTECKTGDIMTFDITADKDFTSIEVMTYGGASAKTITVASTSTTSGTFTVNASGLTTATNKTIKCRVKSPTGSYSAWFESTNNFVVNDLVPTVTLSSTTYPSTQSALKNTESATVLLNIANADTLTPSLIGAELTITSSSLASKTIVVARASGTYNDNTNNLKATCYRNANGSNTVLNTCVCIANVAPTLSSQSLATYNVMSGNGTVTNTLTFGVQKVKVKSVSALTVGTLVTGTTSTYATTYGLGISAQSSDTHSNTALTTNIVVTGMSGLDSASIPITYYVRGFANMVLSLTYPALSKVIGTTVVDVTKLVVSGSIQSTPPLEICKAYVSPSSISTSLADKYSIDATGLNFLLPSAVNGFGYNSSNPIQVNISEVY